MKNILRLGIGGLFYIVSSHAIAFHFETTIANKTNQALTIHCEDHACAYCDADMTIEAGQTIAYSTGYNNGGGIRLIIVSMTVPSLFYILRMLMARNYTKLNCMAHNQTT